MSIEVKNLSFSYGDRPVLHDISFSVEKGEFLSILGPNGVGKSTLFRCMLGLLSGYTGSVSVDGVDARTFSIREAAKHIAYIPQSSRSIFNYSVFDIVLMGRTSGLSTFRSPGKADKELCRWAMEKVGIAHLTCRTFAYWSRETELECYRKIPEQEIFRLMERAAEVGVGIEINSCSMMYTPEEEGDILRIYRIARDCGCRFYCGSDAHHPHELDRAMDLFQKAVDAFGIPHFRGAGQPAAISVHHPVCPVILRCFFLRMWYNMGVSTQQGGSPHG